MDSNNEEKFTINYPEMIIEKSEGSNSSERYVNKLCERIFLPLWTYANVYKKQANGHELCDVLVVFKNNIIIMSDKYCKYGTSGDYKIDWNRWYRKAIDKSANQLFGAEKWIRESPNRVCLDSKCNIDFPIPIEITSKTRFYRIVIARGAKEFCKQYFNGGSGSLRFDSTRCGNDHYIQDDNDEESKLFCIGQVNPQKGFVHVFDDITLDIILRELDTASDFLKYLDDKERLITETPYILAAGEEEILGHYLTNFDNREQCHCFYDSSLSHPIGGIYFGEGTWNDFVSSQIYKIKKIEDKVSYYWDEFLKNQFDKLFNGTMQKVSDTSYASQSKLFELLADTCRLERRIYSSHLIQIFKRTDCYDKIYKVHIPNKTNSSPYFLFLMFPFSSQHTTEENCERRKMLLQTSLEVEAANHSNCRNFIGISFFWSNENDNTSSDIMYIDRLNFTDEDFDYIRETEQLIKQHGYLGHRQFQYESVNEYSVGKKFSQIKCKGKARNLPCPCGSGKKYKKCCGLY